MLPIVLFSLLLIAAIVAIVGSAVGGNWAPLRVLADTSIIWLSLPVMLIALLVAAVLAGLVYAVIKLIEFIPPYTMLAQDKTRLLVYYVRLICRNIVNFFLEANARTAQLSHILSTPARLFSRRSRR